MLADARVSFQGSCQVAEIESLHRAPGEVVVVCVGAQQERRLGIPGEEQCLAGEFGVFGSRAFAGWYNGEAGRRAAIERAVRSARRVAVVGGGNVALDVARILMLGARRQLAEEAGGIPPAAQAALHASAIEAVTVVGRRDALDAAFTAAELRPVLRRFAPTVDGLRLPPEPSALARPQRRIAELWAALDSRVQAPQLEFRFRSIPRWVELSAGQQAVAGIGLEQDGVRGLLRCDLVVTCIGQAVQPAFSLPTADGRVCNDAGRVAPGVYVAGWCKTGPHGTIAATMAGAFETAEAIAADWGAHFTGAQ